jgi:hypothetical protein
MSNTVKQEKCLQCEDGTIIYNEFNIDGKTQLLGTCNKCGFCCEDEQKLTLQKYINNELQLLSDQKKALRKELSILNQNKESSIMIEDKISKCKGQILALENLIEYYRIPDIKIVG